MNIDQWNHCLALLYDENFKEGWTPHECIPSGDRFNLHLTNNYNKPIWDGEYTETLLVNTDFGMGDTIQFYRFLPEAKQYVSRLILRTDEEFCELFTDEIITKEDTIPDFNKIIHLMAIPYLLKKDFVCGKPYLSPNENFPPQPFLKNLDLMKFSKIGVCWQGNPFNPRDELRSIPTNELFHLFPSSDFRFFSLNKIGFVPSQFIDMKNYMHNWNETAHLMKKLDLVISVDTAVIHLAGAMGVPAWLLLKENEWRWGKSEKTVWYDSVRIFRGNTWEKILTEARLALGSYFVHSTA